MNSRCSRQGLAAGITLELFVLMQIFWLRQRTVVTQVAAVRIIVPQVRFAMPFDDSLQPVWRTVKAHSGRISAPRNICSKVPYWRYAVTIVQVHVCNPFAYGVRLTLMPGTGRPFSSDNRR